MRLRARFARLATLDVTPWVHGLRDSIEGALNRSYAGGLQLRGSLSRLEPHGLEFEGEVVRLRLVVAGDLSATFTASPP